MATMYCTLLFDSASYYVLTIDLNFESVEEVLQSLFHLKATGKSQSVGLVVILLSYKVVL